MILKHDKISFYPFSGRCLFHGDLTKSTRFSHLRIYEFATFLFFRLTAGGLELHLVLCFIIENKSRSWYESENMDFCHAFLIRDAELPLVQSNLEQCFCMHMCVDARLEFDCHYRGLSLLNGTELSFPCT